MQALRVRVSPWVPDSDVSKGTVMPQLIHNTDYYFYEKRRDILILEMRIRRENSILPDAESCELAAEPQLTWFRNRGIDSHKTCSPGTLVGWCGHYYIDLDPADPVVLEYTAEFENANGSSLDPEKYAMMCLSYQHWRDSGGIDQYEQYLKDLADPSYEF
jgi:hypothetical protein